MPGTEEWIEERHSAILTMNLSPTKGVGGSAWFLFCTYTFAYVFPDPSLDRRRLSRVPGGRRMPRFVKVSARFARSTLLSVASGAPPAAICARELYNDSSHRRNRLTMIQHNDKPQPNRNRRMVHCHDRHRDIGNRRHCDWGIRTGSPCYRFRHDEWQSRPDIGSQPHIIASPQHDHFHAADSVAFAHPQDGWHLGSGQTHCRGDEPRRTRRAIGDGRIAIRQ